MNDDALADLVAHIARALVDAPDAVDVRDARAPESDGATVFELRVGRDDLGKVIGRNGNTARAIRTVLFAAAARTRRRALLNIVEE